MRQQTRRSSSRLESIVRWSYGSLPFYLGLVGLVLAMLVAVWQYRRGLWRSPMVAWLTLVAVGMVFQSRFAYAPEAAWIGLHHYLPYFLLFAVLLRVLTSVGHWLSMAETLLLVSIPVNLAGIVEYGLKFAAVEAVLADSPWLSWIYQGEHYHRSTSVFSNANVYAGYLVILLGLGLGLMLQRQTAPLSPSLLLPSNHKPINNISPPHSPTRLSSHSSMDTLFSRKGTSWLWTAIALIGIGIVCSGSRNGWLVGMSQIGLVMVMHWRSRQIRLLGTLGIGALFTSAWIGGIGTYEFTAESLISSVAEDSRRNTWGIAWRLIQSRPWLGWGLGSYQHLYPIMNSKIEYLTMSHAHNIGLMLGVELGGVLAIALALPIGYIACRGVWAYGLSKTSLQSRAVLGGYLLALWGMLAFSLFDLPFYDFRVNALNWLALAGVYRLSRL